MPDGTYERIKKISDSLPLKTSSSSSTVNSQQYDFNLVSISTYQFSKCLSNFLLCKGNMNELQETQNLNWEEFHRKLLSICSESIQNYFGRYLCDWENTSSTNHHRKLPTSDEIAIFLLDTLRGGD